MNSSNSNCHPVHTIVRGFSVMCVLVLAAFPAWGQTTASEERWYQVELIVFEQGGDPQDGQENWRTDIELDYPLRWRELHDPDAPTTVEEGSPIGESRGESGSSDDEAYVLLPDDQLGLNAELRRLRQGRQYRVLFHGGWRQPFVENRREPSILIFGGEEFGDHHELEGSINLNLRTYLHIETDLWLSRFATNFGQERPPWPPLPWPPNRPLEADQLFTIDDRGSGLWHQLNQGREDQFDEILSQPYVVENIVGMQQ